MPKLVRRGEAPIALLIVALHTAVLVPVWAPVLAREEGTQTAADLAFTQIVTVGQHGFTSASNLPRASRVARRG